MFWAKQAKCRLLKKLQVGGAGLVTGYEFLPSLVYMPEVLPDKKQL